MIIEMNNISKVYQTGNVEFAALKEINLKLKRGDFVAIVGPSGSGKSTLMNLIGCLDLPTKGNYLLDGREVKHLSSNELAEVRNKKIGFVFQAFNLLPYATAFENVELPLLFAGVKSKNRKERVHEILEKVGLSDKMENKPTEMSGGEMQRVAIARAMANDPEIILADEPTGNLDSKSGAAIVDLFKELWKSGKTIIVITHDEKIAGQLPRIVKLKDGLIESNGYAN